MNIFFFSKYKTFLQSSFRYGNIPQLKSSILELPYNENNLSMLIILPDLCETLANLQTKLNTIDFSKIDQHLKLTPDMQIKIPKFRISRNLLLNSPLWRVRIFIFETIFFVFKFLKFFYFLDGITNII